MKLIHIEGPAPYKTNTFLLIDQGFAAAIDPAAHVSKYLDIIEKEKACLKYILLTHGHRDHIASVDALREKTNAKLIMHTADAKQFGIEANEVYEDGKPIVVGNAKVIPMFTPGHTRGSVCLICEDVMFSGDTLFFNDIGRTDLDGGSYPTIKNSLKRIYEEANDNLQVLPGHGPFSDMATEKKNNIYLRGEA